APLSVPTLSRSPLDDSLAPVANWAIPEPRKASPWYGRSLVALATVGVLFVSYRAGAVESTALDLEQNALLASLEAKVGEPGVDTVSGLTRWLNQLKAAHGLDSLAPTDPIPKAATQPSTTSMSNEAKLPDDAKAEDAAPSA